MHELDQQQLRRLTDRIAPGFDATDFICAETRARLLERLALITLQPQTVVDLGAGTAQTAAELQRIYPDALVIALDHSAAMLAHAGDRATAAIRADAQRLPLADNSVDLVIANMVLPACADPLAVFAEARRVLRTPGLFLFNTLGPDTLKTLRKAFAAVDTAPHVHAFADMHNVGDALVQAGFREPVMDVEQVHVSYTDIGRLFGDLRAAGATNLLTARRRGLTTPRLWRQLLANAENLRDSTGGFPAQLELITGQAWTGAAGRGVQMNDGEAHFPLSRLRQRGL